MEHTESEKGNKHDSIENGDVDANSERQPKFSDFVRIFHYADRLSMFLNVVAFTCAIASGATLPLMTIVFGQFASKFADFAGGSTDPSDFGDIVNEFVLWFIYLFVGRFVVTLTATLSITISGIRTTRALRQAYFEHLLRTEIWYYDTAKDNSPAVQISTNATRINQGIAEKLVLIVQGLSMFFASFIVAISVQWKLALITMSVIPAMFIAIGICIAIDAPIEASIGRAYSNGASLAQEAFASIKTVHAFSAQEGIIQRYDEYLAEAHRYGKKKIIPYGIMSGSIYFCIFSGNALAFWQGYRMFLSGEISAVGDVFTVVMSTVIASTSTNIFFPQIAVVSTAIAAASEFFRIMDKPSELDPLSDEGQKPDKCTGAIELDNVAFAYPSRPSAQVLQGFTLSIPAGKTTALVGSSGSGKSTLVGLLERWYQPSGGCISIDGVDITKLNTKWLRSQISLVQQEPVLFQGTVFQNVAKGFLDTQKALPYDEQLRLVQEACKASYAHDFIQALPQGYSTYLGERGGTLSGGQKQRVAIARSIVSDPKILLLDEATSALDPQAERVVQEALNHVSNSRTTVMIAHRLSTVKNADNIAVISNGKLVEQGTHEELIALQGNYAALVKAQDLHSNFGEPGKETVLDAQKGSDVSDEHLLTNPNSFITDEKQLVKDKDGANSTEKRSIWGILFLILREQESIYFLLVVISFGCVLAAATHPGQAILFSRLIQVFTPNSEPDPGAANFTALMFFVIALGNLVAYTIVGGLSVVVSQLVTHDYRSELFKRIINMDIEFFDQRENTSGALASNLMTVPNNLQELISINIFVLLILVISLIASSGLALGYGWKLALVMIFAGLPIMIGAAFVQLRLETKMNDTNEARFSDSASLAVEAVGALRTVSSLTLESDLLTEYAENLRGILRQSAKTMVVSMSVYAFAQSVDFLVMALGFWYGSRLLVSLEYTTEQFFVVFMSILLAGQGAAQFLAAAGSITRAKSAGTFLLDLRDKIPRIRETDENRDNSPDGHEGVALDQVDFTYPGRSSQVIRGVSMQIAPGQFTAFVGHSGCGKSTLISLLERYYDPTSGKIRLGDENIQNFSPKRYRTQLSLVQQEPVLFQGTVTENIALGALETPTEEEIHDAAKQANAYDFIISLPQGFNTPTGKQGTSFSGGQRQRIAIARALIRRPKVLLLDEATSALDTQSERLVQSALDTAGKMDGRTTIAVAHRLSTIRDADVIYVFANGKIIESGSHAELQQKRGVYHEMCLAQSLDKAVDTDGGEISS
ncbi:P-loop containing nucleoside triphosphate hydrolase protein [Aspergillus granulosus]|uniref:P-loop containing nucleoside triphosphate hydrolase protein n=1 Tax=Aspergillus granulosus TaxID=176169 RepID=A0ABR4HWQ5_9EURO